MFRQLRSWLQRRIRLVMLIVLVFVAYIGAINRAHSLPWFIAAMLRATRPDDFHAVATARRSYLFLRELRLGL